MPQQTYPMSPKRDDVLIPHGHPAAEKQPLSRRIILWLGVLSGLTLSVLILIHITEPPPTPLTGLKNQTPLQTRNQVHQNVVLDWTKGHQGVGPVLIEYGDFQCGVCRRYYRLIKRLSEELGDNFQYTFRHYPLEKHTNAILAAKAAEAAGVQGKFWEMHDQLFEKQREWAGQDSALAEEIFSQYAQQLLLDVEKFRIDLHSETVVNKVTHSTEMAHRNDVIFTPTFVLNGKKIDKNPRTYDAFKALIDSN